MRAHPVSSLGKREVCDTHAEVGENTGAARCCDRNVGRRRVPPRANVRREKASPQSLSGRSRGVASSRVRGEEVVRVGRAETKFVGARGERREAPRVEGDATRASGVVGGWAPRHAGRRVVLRVEAIRRVRGFRGSFVRELNHGGGGRRGGRDARREGRGEGRERAPHIRRAAGGEELDRGPGSRGGLGGGERDVRVDARRAPRFGGGSATGDGGARRLARGQRHPEALRLIHPRFPLARREGRVDPPTVAGCRRHRARAPVWWRDSLLGVTSGERRAAGLTESAVRRRIRIGRAEARRRRRRPYRSARAPRASASSWARETRRPAPRPRPVAARPALDPSPRAPPSGRAPRWSSPAVRVGAPRWAITSLARPSARARTARCTARSTSATGRSWR